MKKMRFKMSRAFHRSLSRLIVVKNRLWKPRILVRASRDGRKLIVKSPPK